MIDITITNHSDPDRPLRIQDSLQSDLIEDTVALLIDNSAVRVSIDELIRAVTACKRS